MICMRTRRADNRVHMCGELRGKQGPSVSHTVWLRCDVPPIPDSIASSCRVMLGELLRRRRSALVVVCARLSEHPCRCHAIVSCVGRQSSCRMASGPCGAQHGRRTECILALNKLEAGNASGLLPAGRRSSGGVHGRPEICHLRCSPNTGAQIGNSDDTLDVSRESS